MTYMSSCLKNMSLDSDYEEAHKMDKAYSESDLYHRAENQLSHALLLQEGTFCPR